MTLWGLSAPEVEWTPVARGHSPRPDAGAPSVDKKDVTVWKLPEQVTKQEFRHWLDTIDTNLDAVHRFKYPKVMLD